ncbi:hypothetical protein T11_13724 [Trichinella zimbabwensis]|uniref:Uncharacterized protein n=1 Tax=Trichinella zimbabwensis TaxID=268475 RepID=A0A0V1H9M3_9BILA|nr:hypothetical protein T11_13724 [Trichinella zimbabwensis]
MTIHSSSRPSTALAGRAEIFALRPGRIMTCDSVQSHTGCLRKNTKTGAFFFSAQYFPLYTVLSIQVSLLIYSTGVTIEYGKLNLCFFPF